METIKKLTENPFTIIEKQLEKITIVCDNNYGLYNGKTGLCICYFLLAAITEDKGFEAKARILLDELSDNINSVEQLDFANGLAGIGWGIEWLVQNKFVDANTDEVLEDLDDELYKSVVYAKAKSLSLLNGTLGKAMFFHKRLIAQNPGTTRYRNLCTQECLVLLSDEINETLLNKETGLLSSERATQNYTSLQLTEIAQCLIFLTKLVPLGINAEITEKLICNILSFIQESKDVAFSCNDKEWHEAYHYLLYAYLLAGTKLSDNCIVKNATNLLKDYSFANSSTNAPHFFNQYLNNRVMNLLQQKTKEQPELIPTTIFDILVSCRPYIDSQLHSWNEAWLLS